MANEKRLRTNLVAGALLAAITSGDTSMSSDGLADLGVVDSTNHAALVFFTIDSTGRITAKEIVYVTAHTAAATTATIVRGKEGTSAAAWTTGSTWAHVATSKDFDGLGGGSGLIGLTQYNPASDTAVTTGSSSLVDADATNAIVTFTAPPSGKVLHRVSVVGRNALSLTVHLGLRDASGIIAGSGQRTIVNSDLVRMTLTFVETGLTPGTSYTRRLAFSNGGANTAELRWGTVNERGPLVMEVWAVNF